MLPGGGHEARLNRIPIHLLGVVEIEFEALRVMVQDRGGKGVGCRMIVEVARQIADAQLAFRVWVVGMIRAGLTCIGGGPAPPLGLNRLIACIGAVVQGDDQTGAHPVGIRVTRQIGPVGGDGLGHIGQIAIGPGQAYRRVLLAGAQHLAAFEERHRLVGPPLLHAEQAVVHHAVILVGIKSDGLLIACLGGLQILAGRQQIAQYVMHIGPLWIDGQNAPCQGLGGGPLPAGDPKLGELLQSREIMGFNLQGLLKVMDRFVDALLVKVEPGQGQMDLGDAGIQGQGLAKMLLSGLRLLLRMGKQTEQLVEMGLPGIDGQNLPIDLFRLMQPARLVVTQGQLKGFIQGHGLGGGGHEAPQLKRYMSPSLVQIKRSAPTSFGSAWMGSSSLVSPVTRPLMGSREKTRPALSATTT